MELRSRDASRLFAGDAAGRFSGAPCVHMTYRAPKNIRFAPLTQVLNTIGVAGAGTMGAGIAQLACLAGARTFVYDPDAQALERGIKQIGAQLERGAARGRWSEDEAVAAAERIEPAPALEDLQECELVIE